MVVAVAVAMVVAKAIPRRGIQVPQSMLVKVVSGVGPNNTSLINAP
jgi:hypothetical protein